MTDSDGLLDMMGSAVGNQARAQRYKPDRLETDFRPAFDSWKATPGPQTAGALVKSVQPVLDSVTRPLGDSPVIRGRARQMALQAFQTYDPARASLRTHLMNQMQGLRRVSAQHDMPIRVPERVVLQRQQLKDAEAELFDKNGRMPSDAELADYTGLSVKRIGHVRAFQRPHAEGSFAQGDDENVGSDPGVQGSIPQSIMDDFVYDGLSARDQLIFDAALGRNGRPKMTTQQLAQQLGVTSGAISQRLAAIQQRYASLEDMGLFGG